MPKNDLFEIRVEVNHVTKLLSRHQTVEACHRKFVYWEKLLFQGVLINVACQARLMSVAPSGATQEMSTFTAPQHPETELSQGMPSVVVDTTAHTFENEQDQRSWAKIMDRLKSAGVATVTVAYDGYGDSGDKFEVDATDAAGHDVKLDPVVEARIDEMCCADIVPDGYENGDGGYGNIQIDVAKREIKLSHSQRYMSSEEESNEWKIPELSELSPDGYDEEDEE